MCLQLQAFLHIDMAQIVEINPFLYKIRTYDIDLVQWYDIDLVQPR